MYADYFGLQELPFSIAPDPRFLYLGAAHREALAHLNYGIGEQGGFVVLTGEVGTGKTTVSRCLIQQLLRRDDVQLAFIINPRQSVKELLQSVCAELGIAFNRSRERSKDLVDALNRHLLEAHAEGRHTVLMIDEAQNLSVEVLEQLRLLTNLETNDKKLLQLILLGQPELNAMLARPELRQLSQRVTARYHLEPLKKTELREYVEHRLRISGTRQPLFTRQALRRLYSKTGGIPRLVNVMCDRSLLGAYAMERPWVTAAMVSRAAGEVLPADRGFKRGRLVLVLSMLVLLSGSLFLYTSDGALRGGWEQWWPGFLKNSASEG